MPDVKFSNQYPYTDFHELNLDWVIKEVKFWSERVGKSIQKIELTGTVGLVDTYTITYSDGSTSTFDVTNGNGIASVAKTGTAGLVDTYTITFQDGSTTTFEVHNGTASIDDTLTRSGWAADAKVTGDCFDDIPTSKYRSEYNTDGKYLDSSGNEVTYSGWSITGYMKIGEKGFYNMPNPPAWNSSVRSCFYDSSKTFISSFQTLNSDWSSLTAPSGAVYVRFTIRTSDSATFDYSSQPVLSGKKERVNGYNLVGNDLMATFKNRLIYGEFYNIDGTIGTSATWARSGLYRVNPGDLAIFDNVFGSYAVMYDSDKSFVSNMYTNTTITHTSFIIPSGVSYIGVSMTQSNISNFNCEINGVTLGSVYKIDWLDAGTSVWFNKTYISHGDSITWRDGKIWEPGYPHAGEIARGYQTVFSEAVGLAGYNNQGKSGWSMAVVGGNGVVNTIMSIADYSIYNLCTIACGTNDFKLNVPLGSLGQIGDVTFDDTTFYGAYRKAVEYILTNSPEIRIVLMTPLQRDNDGYDVNYTNSAGAKLIDYVNAVKQIGEMYGLPVCDMYGNSGFTEKTLATYTLDGLHPNTEGYERMGGYLTQFLNGVGL